MFVSIATLCLASACEDNDEGDSKRKTVSDQEITLDFAFGTRKGTYSGEVNDNGIPDGVGTFSSKNDEGTGWTYNGDWENGHWNGKGTSVYDTGDKYSGNYRNDYANGYGEYQFANGNRYVGVVANEQASGQGKLYYFDGNVERCFVGKFKDFSNATGYVQYGGSNQWKASMSNGNISFLERLEPAIGMTETEILNSTWGAPKRKNKTTTSYGTSVQWAYDKGYITFSDGTVSAIQENG